MPAIRKADPKATIVGFAGVDLAFMKKTLAMGTGPLMDVVSEHSYGQYHQPEVNLPEQMKAVRALLRAAARKNRSGTPSKGSWAMTTVTGRR